MERVDANLIPFAKNNPSGYRFAFGTDTATDDINVNYNDNIKKGWGTTPNEFPEVEDFNAMAYTSSYLTAYLYQMGIPEWNNKQNYRQYSRAMGSNGIIYMAKTGTDLAPNVNNNPTTDSTNWKIDTQFDINTFTDKATPADTDNLAIQEVGGLFKKLSWSNLKATIVSSFGAMIGTLTEKTTVDANDLIVVADSAGSNASKKVTLANLKTFISPNSTETVAGIVELATTAEAQAGTNDTTAITPLKLFNSLKGSNQNLATAGYQKLHSGLIIQWGANSVGSGTETTVTLPLAFPNNTLQVVATRKISGVAATAIEVHAFPLSASQIKLSFWVSGGGNQDIAWIAIGY